LIVGCGEVSTGRIRYGPTAVGTTNVSAKWIVMGANVSVGLSTTVPAEQ
jgi:hypothetical protein